MSGRKTRCLLLLVAFGCAAATALAQSPHSAPLRRPPTRTSSAVKIGDSYYVPSIELERRGGLKAVWKRRNEVLVLSNERHRIELQVDSREAEVDGLRVYLGEPTKLGRGVLMISKTDLEVALLPVVQPAVARNSSKDLRVIALDAGHGGEDNGTMNKALGLKEKVFTLDVVLRLKKVLEARGFRVVLTRSTDDSIPLALRSEMANRAGADLFVSVHFNSLHPDTRTNGVEVYTFAPRGQRSVGSWGTKDDDTENDASPVNQYDQWSVVLAHSIHKDLVSTLRSADRGRKIKHLGVLRRLNCPGVLIESAFLSNEAEARKVANPNYRQQTAESIARGIQTYALTLATARR